MPFENLRIEHGVYLLLAEGNCIMQIQSVAVALVSGGSSGLGGASVRRLATAGARVVIADLNQEAGEKLATELGAGVQLLSKRMLRTKTA